MNFEGQYLTYTEYQTLGGTLEQTPFNLLEFEARKNIDKYTFGRLKNLDSQVDEVKQCVYRLIEIINSYNNSNQNRAISSENTDGYSVTYAGATKEFTKAKESELRSTIETYLSDCRLDDGTGYLYMG